MKDSEIFNDSLDFNDSDDNNNNKLLFSIEINLSNEKTQKINIFSNSNPNKIAYDFSILYNLDFDSHQQLLEKIKYEISKYNQIKKNNFYKYNYSNNSIKKIRISNNLISYENNFHTINNNNNNNKMMKKIENKFKKNSNEKIKKKSKSSSMKNIFDDNIYNRNLLYLKNKNEKIKEIKEQLDKSQDELNTFQPKINKISKIAYENRIKNKKQFNNNEIISNYYSYKKEKNKKLFSKLYKNDQIKYSFHPNLKQTYKKNRMLISKSSKNLNYSSRFNLLYDDYKLRQEKIKEKKKLFLNFNEYTFKPEINKRKKKTNSNSDTFNRLYSYANIYKANILKKKNDDKFNQTEKILYTNLESNKIFYNKIRNNFKKIFNILDNDQDGFISSAYCNTQNLEKDILNIINVIINTLRKSNVNLGEEEFIQSCFILFDTLNFEEKNKIIKFKENKIPQKTPFEIKNISFTTFEKYYEDLIKHSNNSTINNNNHINSNYSINNNNNSINFNNNNSTINDNNNDNNSTINDNINDNK